MSPKKAEFFLVLKSMLKPAVRLCIRKGIRIQELTECLKSVFIELGTDLLETQGEKGTTSRLSVVTGMHRRDVKRLQQNDSKLSSTQTLPQKVVGHWQTIKKYRTKAGKPRVLTYGKVDSEFSQLVCSVSQDLNPATILYELERLSIVARTKSGVKLIKDSYQPGSEDEIGRLNVVAQDFNYLSQGANLNIFGDPETPNLHRRTEYDRVRKDELQKIREYILAEGKCFHKSVREFVSQYDLDINPDESYDDKTTHVVVGSFSTVDEEE